MAAPGQPELSSVNIDSKTYFVARDRDGRTLHETVSTGKELKESWDFRNGSWGMGETARQTETGYFFTENIDATKRGLRLSPTIGTGAATDAFIASARPVVFWEAQHPTEGTRWLYYARPKTATTFSVTKHRLADGQSIEVTYTSGGATAVYPCRPVRFNGAWVLPVDVIGATDTEAWQVRQDSGIGDDHSAFSPVVTLAEVLDTTETGVDVNDASGISVNDIISVERERMLVTAKVTNTLTVTRAYLGTTAETHATSTSVENATESTKFAADAVSVNDTATSVQLAFLLDQTSGTPTIARVVNDAQIEKYSTTATGAALATSLTTDANFTNVGGGDGFVGDASSKALGAASHAGVTLLGKQDNLYAFDKDGNSYAVIPSINRFVDSVNPNSGTSSVGSGTVSYGADTFYPHPSGLWLVRFVAEAKNISVDKIAYYSKSINITPPIRLRYLEGTALGDWVYWIYAAQEQGSTASYLLAMKFDRHPANQLGVVWHTLLKRSAQMRSLWIDSSARLRWTEESATNVKHIQLSADGSPDASSRGEVSSTYEWYGPEVDFGEPEVVKQFRYAFVEVEGGVGACSWQVKYYRDSDISPTSLGSAITTTDGTNLTWTPGSADTGRRLRMRITATTNGSFVAGTDDPKVLHMNVYARSADVVRMVITPKDRRSQRNMFETVKVLRKLKDAGPITIREPDTNETHSAYIKTVGIIRYDSLTGPAQGIELILERYTAAA